MTALVTGRLRNTSAVFFRYASTMALISSGANVFLPCMPRSTWMRGLPLPRLPPCPASDGTTLYGMRSTSADTPSSSYFCPMMRFTSKMVLAGKRAALFLAA